MHENKRSCPATVPMDAALPQDSGIDQLQQSDKGLILEAKGKQTMAEIQNQLRSVEIMPQFDPDDPDNENKRPHGKYVESNKHHNNSRGDVSKPPRDGQSALNNSYEVKNSPHRIAIENGKYVALYETVEGTYHGFVCETWNEVPRALQKAFQVHKLVHPKTGVILK